MTTSESFQALHRANPRLHAGFPQAVEALGSRIDMPAIEDAPRSSRPHHVARVGVAGAAVALVAAVAVFLVIGSSGRAPGVEDAAAAVAKAATLTAASAERSGTAIVRMTHDGAPWAGKTIRWNGADLETVRDEPGQRRGMEWLLVDGMLYGIDPENPGGWLEIGPPSSIDPGSGTTPDELLAAVREDVGGTTLRRIVSAMAATRLTETHAADGSTVYSGKVAAGSLARETGFKEGQAIRVLPFGYVAHDAAADPANLLDTSITIGSEGVVRELAVTWPGWTYTVTYGDLGSTPAPAAPAQVRKLGRF
jgi:hypothetical protein